VVDPGYEEDPTIDPKVAEYLHISEVFEHASEFGSVLICFLRKHRANKAKRRQIRTLTPNSILSIAITTSWRCLTRGW